MKMLLIASLLLAGCAKPANNAPDAALRSDMVQLQSQHQAMKSELLQLRMEMIDRRAGWVVPTEDLREENARLKQVVSQLRGRIQSQEESAARDISDLTHKLDYTDSQLREVAEQAQRTQDELESLRIALRR